MTNLVRSCLIVGLQGIATVIATGCSPRDVEVQPQAQVESRPVPAPPAQRQGLIDDIRAQFQQRNPKIVTVRVLDATTPFIGASKHLVVGWGVCEDREFRGDFNDELFGVFVANGTLTAIERTVDVFPTRRWSDYGVRIESSNANSVTIVGRGDTYGDSRMRRTYEWYVPDQAAPN